MTQPFREIAIEGPRGWTAGYVQGFVRGRSASAVVLDAEHEGCDVASARERFREFLSRGSEIAHLLVEDSAAALVHEAVEAAAAGGRLVQVRLERSIVGASFGFSVECFSEVAGRRIREFLRNLPEGVKTSADTEIDEIVDPSARGIEPYAPIHDFEFRARGTVLGDVAGVLRVHRVLDGDELVDVSGVRLQEG